MKTFHHSHFASLAIAIVAAGIARTPAPLVAAQTPVVATLSASNVTASSAVLKGTVNPNGLSTTAWLEWGAGDTFHFATTRTNVGSGTSTLDIGSPISGLTAGTIYHFRVAASNTLGIVRGTSVRFGVPQLTVLGSNPQSNPLNTNFVDEGVLVTATPVTIAAGFRHNLTLKADGQIVGWGQNDNGQSTVTNLATNAVAIAAGDLHSLALRANGSVVGWGYTNDGAINIPPTATHNVIAIAAGGYHSLALKRDGTVVGWGGDWDGQSTIPAGATNVIALAAGNSHSLALKADGTVIGWGTPWDGQLDAPANATNVIAIAAGGDHSLALKDDGTVVAWGSDSDGQSTIPGGTTNVIAIAAGYRHSLALQADGTIVCWGAGDEGQTTAPATATNSIAIAAGVNHSISLRADGTLVYWGIADSVLTNTPAGLNTPTNIFVGVSGTVITNLAGSYSVTYAATNVLGLATTATRTVFIGDPFPIINSRNILENGAFQIGFDFTPNLAATVLASTNIAIPATHWTVLGQATESPAGHYQFTDMGATNFVKRFYRVKIP